MDKLVKNIIFGIGLILCLAVFLLNIVFVANLANDLSEIVSIKFYGILNIEIMTLVTIGLISIFNKCKNIKISKKVQIFVVIIIVFLYAFAQIVWINLRDATPVADQKTVHAIAEKMYKGEWKDLKNEKYLELCPQQVTLSFCYSVIFQIFNTSSVRLLQYINVVANVITVIAILMITKLIGKDYKINKAKSLILSVTFFTLPLLSTFIYGDILSFPLILFAVYFSMKYVTLNKKYNMFISAILMTLSYMLRMNNLIIIIALIIYFFLDIIKVENRNLKNVGIKTLLLICFVLITFAPALTVKSIIQNKLNYNKQAKIPTVLYLCMGMEEGSRANGWFNENAAFGWENPIEAKPYYKEKISHRLKFLATNPTYTIKFYVLKTTSMWAENTYASIWYNETFNFSDVKKENANQLDEFLVGKTDKIQMYQKSLILIIFGTTILVLLTKRKKLSNEVLLLITIFIGGFLFQNLWEGKSRYIIAYIIVLIPIASICIEDLSFFLPSKKILKS